jgi:hypothetical protein
MKKLLATAALLVAFALPAKAVDFEYTGSFSSTPNANNIAYTATFNTTAFSIGIPAPGFIEIDNLITLDSNEPFLIFNQGDAISATFNFTEPGVGNGSVTGTGTAFGFFLGGLIDWSGPTLINFAGFPGSSLLVTLEDTLYSLHHPIKIDGRFDAVGTFAVPGPAVGAGLPALAGLMGLLGFNFFRRRRSNEVVSA